MKDIVNVINIGDARYRLEAEVSYDIKRIGRNQHVWYVELQ